MIKQYTVLLIKSIYIYFFGQQFIHMFRGLLSHNLKNQLQKISVFYGQLERACHVGDGIFKAIVQPKLMDDGVKQAECLKHSWICILRYFFLLALTPGSTKTGGSALLMKVAKSATSSAGQVSPFSPLACLLAKSLLLEKRK